ncbi:MAG: T9SS type A sorting domain-containing protein, partial [Bacteroidota bacterium]|nr:T9SS type A sorting domain-containing protein [Bacteroidota bacterium]
KGDKVEIIVYDVLGNKIATLLEGYKPAGNHSIQFNAKNLPSGVYIYRIKSGAFMASKKMMLVK